MLINLEVLNGDLSPKFDSYNLIYTVNINNDISYLDLVVEAEDGFDINIIGNDVLFDGENTVLIELSNNNYVNTYTLNVIKETVVTNVIIEEPTALEIPKELPAYTAPLIGMICFLIILIFYTLLFHKKK